LAFVAIHNSKAANRGAEVRAKIHTLQTSIGSIHFEIFNIKLGFGREAPFLSNLTTNRLFIRSAELLCGAQDVVATMRRLFQHQQKSPVKGDPPTLSTTASTSSAATSARKPFPFGVKLLYNSWLSHVNPNMERICFSLER
jgi:hypothetical protein